MKRAAIASATTPVESDSAPTELETREWDYAVRKFMTEVHA
jgi:hypothetical protein